MNASQKEQLRYELRCLRIHGWDHCCHCNRSQSRFEFYYQEQFDEAVKLAGSCVFCGNELSTYHETEDGPFSRPEGWKVPNKAEFSVRLEELNEKYGINDLINELTVDKFKSSAGDYMGRQVCQ